MPFGVCVVDGNLGLAAHMWSEVDDLICSKRLFRSKELTYNYEKTPVFLHICAIAYELPSNHGRLSKEQRKTFVC